MKFTNWKEKKLIKINLNEIISPSTYYNKYMIDNKRFDNGGNNLMFFLKTGNNTCTYCYIKKKKNDIVIMETNFLYYSFVLGNFSLPLFLFPERLTLLLKVFICIFV